MGILGLFKKNILLVGLDIGEDIIRAEYAPDKIVSIPTPAGAINDGAIVAPGKISKALKELWARNGIRVKRVVIAVRGEGVILRVINLPSAKDDKIREILQNKVNQYVTFAGTDTLLDWKVLEEVAEEGVKKNKVLFAAAKAPLVQSYIEAVQKAGLEISGIVPPALAVVRALSAESLGSRLPDQLKALVAGAAEQWQKQVAAGLGTVQFKPEVEDALVVPGLAANRPLMINLLPPETKSAEEWRRHIFYFLCSLCGIAFLTLTLFFALNLACLVKNAQVAAVKSELAKPTLLFTRLKKIEDNNRETDRLFVNRQKLVNRHKEFDWNRALKELPGLSPPDVRLTGIDFRAGDTILLMGEARLSDGIFDLISRLRGSEYFKSIDLQLMRLEDKTEASLIRFEIRVEKPDK